MLDWRLWVSLFLSLGLHVSLCLFAIGNGRGSENTRYPLSVVLREKGSDGAVSSPSPLVAPTGERINARNATQGVEERHRDPTVGPQIVAVGEELDAAPLPIVDPVVEPEYGFADDVDGVITLSLLVDTEGRVVFDFVVNNDFDEPTTGYLRQQFRSLRFRPPTSNGKPVYAWLSYVVTIRRKDLP